MTDGDRGPEQAKAALTGPCDIGFRNIDHRTALRSEWAFMSICKGRRTAIIKAMTCGAAAISSPATLSSAMKLLWALQDLFPPPNCHRHGLSPAGPKPARRAFCRHQGHRSHGPPFDRLDRKGHHRPSARH